MFVQGQMEAYACRGSFKPFILTIDSIQVLKPQVVILDIGTNDIVSEYDPASVACFYHLHGRNSER